LPEPFPTRQSSTREAASLLGCVERTVYHVTDWGSLVAAYHEARRGKRHDAPVDRWFRTWEQKLLSLQQRLRQGYRFGAYRTFTVHEPKTRLVAAAPFDDRVVHHLLVRALGPVVERAMVPTTFACRQGLGQRAAREALMKQCRSGRALWFVQCDVRRYFPSIRHDLLLGRLSRSCGDEATRALLASLLDSWHTPGAPGTGIPVGNLTSQLFANLYLSSVDRYMLRTAGARGFLRYVDDMVWFGDDLPALHAQRAMLADRLSALGLSLHPGKTRVGRVQDGVDFVGVVATARTLRLRGATLRRGLRFLAATRRRCRRGEVTEGVYLARLRSFVAFGRSVRALGMLARRGFWWQ
jgi:retron-type reverse transcriptase